MAPARIHALVHGRVQGVGFRFFVLDRGMDLGVTGWVRNLHDGRVEIVAEGEPNRLDQLLADLRMGPRGAYVEDVAFENLAATGEFDAFRIAR